MLYWFINNAIYTRYSVQDRIEVENKEKDKKLNTKSTSKSKSKELKMKERKDNKVIIISVCIVITIAIISGSILINTYSKLENKNKNEIDRQENLYACITDAKNNRNDLYYPKNFMEELPAYIPEITEVEITEKIGIVQNLSLIHI